ncbi:hypothetical protein BDY21DRAFT_368215 [Lineolata rhizophorae]|uniref:Cupredoxin n=1 Tax=Lineolata rhizophorae TaxID=578093 RepID=A0A6A6PDP2_9PEZI|nr:hypothetical protein BDY21DRAFT_368215 [Lineolata rhizophorae]
MVLLAGQLRRAAIAYLFGAFLGAARGQSFSTVTQSTSITASASLADASSTSSREPVTHTVDVGRYNHEFTPDVTQAEPGDTVEFRFYPTNHSVVRAEYENPCIPYEMTGRGKIGFFSDFKPVDAYLEDPPLWQVLINDTDPIFYYCSAPGSCINYGMVGVINPSANTSLQVQRDLAQDSDFMLQPGEDFPDEATSTPGTADPTASRTGGSSSATGASSASDEDPDDDGDDDDGHGGPHLSAGAIAGIAIGAAAVVAIAALLFYLFGRNRTLAAALEKRDSTTAGARASVGPFGRPPPPGAAAAGPDVHQTPAGAVYVPVATKDAHNHRGSAMSGAPYGHAPPYGYDDGSHGLSPRMGDGAEFFSPSRDRYVRPFA